MVTTNDEESAQKTAPLRAIQQRPFSVVAAPHRPPRVAFVTAPRSRSVAESRNAQVISLQTLSGKAINNYLRELDGADWITALTNASIAKLERGGSIQMSLFDERDLVSITHPDYPDERLVVCRNPFLADERKREVLLQATEKLLAAVQKKVLRKRKPLRGKDAIGIEVGKVVNRKKVAKHFALTIADDSFVYARKAEKIRREAALDGLYVIRSSVAAERMTDAELVANYKNLEMVERAFRSLKSLDINVRPIHHRLEGRVRAHIFICLLAYYVEQTMRKMLAPLLFVDEEKEEPSAMADAGKAAGGVVRGASRSASACRKDSEKKSADGAFGVASFRDILGHFRQSRGWRFVCWVMREGGLRRHHEHRHISGEFWSYWG